MNILHFNDPEEGFVWIAVLSVICIFLWTLDRLYPDFGKRHKP